MEVRKSAEAAFVYPDSPDSPAHESTDWSRNYFNYFTEIEEHFQKVRGTSLFLLSPLDWALIESWKISGVPLEAVLRGIDAAFEKWKSRKTKTQQVNSLAYCTQAVLKEAQRMLDQQTGSEPDTGKGPSKAGRAPFSREALVRYLEGNAKNLEGCAEEKILEIALTLRGLTEDAAAAPDDLAGFDTEDLERRLTALEEKLLAHLRVAQSDEAMLAIRRELDAQLKPYRSKMNAQQLRQLEDQYLERKLLSQARLPRLSLFYMTDFGE